MTTRMYLIAAVSLVLGFGASFGIMTYLAGFDLNDELYFESAVGNISAGYQWKKIVLSSLFFLPFFWPLAMVFVKPLVDFFWKKRGWSR